MERAMSARSIATIAPAKLNLFLHVTGRRADGYHLLQTVFTLLDHGDRIEVTVTGDGQVRRLRDVEGVPEDTDLAIRAARLLQTETGTSQGAAITVEKHIPVGGGLGGGSSDAATVLLALNRLWDLGLTKQELAAIGLKLGADVPFFLFGNSAWAEGVGELLAPVEIPLWWYLVLTPAVQVSTPWVFAQPDLTRNTPPIKIADFSASGLGRLQNDLQPVVLKAFPEVNRATAALGQVAKKSLFGARMTGSGACVFAAFESGHDAREALLKIGPEIPGFVAQGLARHPLG
jgi:4-diphosphocytidyl-2-C-methyl-D-erythritol kinase